MPKSELPECDKEIKFKKWTDCYGTHEYKNGIIYIGEWLKGKSHGQGKMTFESGAIYIGEWKKDRRDGKGFETYIDSGNPKSQVWYEGEFKKGKRHGQGTGYWADGATYVGAVKRSISWTRNFYRAKRCSLGR